MRRGKEGFPAFAVTEYAIATPKVDRPVRLAVVSDLHGCPYGERQEGLLAALSEGRSDAILMAGDMSDVRDTDEPFWEFLQGAVRLAPCYYVTGNHEFGRHSSSHVLFPRETVERRKDGVRALGIRVLEGEKETLPGTDGRVAILGIDDIFVGKQEFERQYFDCCRLVEKEQYAILLSHRPELMQAYRLFPGDLVVSGHAHGGQWRLPGVKGGLYAPGQGLFPRYSGGCYRRPSGQLLVSRGLCYRYPKLPRFGNPPELVFVTLRPGRQGGMTG